MCVCESVAMREMRCQQHCLTIFILYTYTKSSGDLMNDICRHFDWSFFIGSTHRKICLMVLKEVCIVHLSTLESILKKKRREHVEFEKIRKVTTNVVH